MIICYLMNPSPTLKYCDTSQSKVQETSQFPQQPKIYSMSSVKINFTDWSNEMVRIWPHLQDKRSYIQIRRGRQESFKIVLESFPNGKLMRFINLILTTHSSCHLCLQVMSYIRTSLDLLFTFVRSSSSLGRMPCYQQACSVLRWVYLVIPQAGTHCQQTYLVSQWASLLNPQRLDLHLLRF